MLRDVVEGDLPIFFAQQQDREALAMATMPGRDREAFYRHWRVNILGDERVAKKTIVERGEVAGHVVCWTHEERRMVGYFLGRAHWGRGLASAGLAEMVARHESARPIFAHVAVTNVASIRVLEKCGFARFDGPAIADDGVLELLMRLA